MFLGKQFTPNSPCMAYLPTFTVKTSQTWVNVPYMDDMGTFSFKTDVQNVGVKRVPILYTRNLGKINKNTNRSQFFVTFLGWLSDFKG